jgi:amino acid permease
MAPKLQPFINWRAFIIFLLCAFAAAYAATYPQLDPNHFNWKTAFITFLLAFVSYIVYHINTVQTQQSLTRIVDALPATPSTPADTKQDDGGPPTRRAAAVDLKNSPDQFMPPR